ncbi:MAG: protease SohB [Pseudohongiellaceae bacterium]
MEYLLEYGMFLAKVVTLSVAIIFVTVMLVTAGGRQRKGDRKGHIKVTKLNDQLEEMQESLQQVVLDKAAYKAEQKRKKQQRKQSAKSKQTAAPQESGKPDRRRAFVVNFKGDIAAHAVESLREEVTTILTLAIPEDEVILRLESPGGMVHAYGLASSQLMRVKERKIPLTICVDKVAASGGYMMACLADKLVAAPFAIIGSIGVLVQMPNFHRVLKKNEIDYETITAGEFKTTLTTFGEITQKGRDKVKEDVEDMHGLFKKWVKDHRPSVDIDKISTGETWVGMQAKDRYMVDEIRTSDDVIIKACADADVYEIEYEPRKTLHGRISEIFKGTLTDLVNEILGRSGTDKFYS